MHTMIRMRTMVIKMIVIMNMLRLIRKMLMVLVIFVYDYTPGRPKIAHWLPRGGPKISHDKVKLDSDLPHLQRYAPRCSHSNNFVQLSDRDVFH